MKTVFHIIILVSMMAVLPILAAEQNSYFLQIDIKDRDVIGKKPIKEKEVKSEDCFQITRNEQGKLTKVSHLTDGKLTDCRWGLATITVERTPDSETWTILDAKGEPAGLDGG